MMPVLRPNASADAMPIKYFPRRELELDTRFESARKKNSILKRVFFQSPPGADAQVNS